MLTSIVAVLTFLLFTAPGFLFQLLADRRRPSVTESAFRDASRVLFSGLIFSMASLGLLAMGQLVGLDAVPDLRLLILQPRADLAENYASLFAFVVLVLSVSLVLAVLCHVALRRLTVGLIVPRSAWDQVLKESVPPGTRVRVRVKTESGTVVVGDLSSFTAGMVVPDERELALEQPLWIKARSGTELKRIDKEWQRHIFSGRNIVSISVAYWEKGEPARKVSRWQHWLATLQKWI